VERDEATQLALTDQGRAVLNALLQGPQQFGAHRHGVPRQAFARRLLPPVRPGVGTDGFRSGCTPCAGRMSVPARDLATGLRS
jgi:hypothetical protein